MSDENPYNPPPPEPEMWPQEEPEPPRQRGTRKRPEMDRLPPNDTAAEQGVLGCILLSPNDCMGECIEKLKPGALAFYDLRHQTLFQEMTTMYDERLPIDLITLPGRLRDRKQLDNVGGIAYISTLPDATPSAANLQYYLDIVLEKYLLRKTLQICAETAARIYDHEGDVEELLDGVERDILEIGHGRQGATTPPVRDLVQTAINTIEECHQRKGLLTGIATGFVDFDKMTTGMHEGEMITIAARPSVGKTSIAMNIAEHVAVELKLPVGVFSLEMTADQLMLRMLCSRARVNLRNVRDGFLAERDFPRLTGAAGRLATCPLYIDDGSALSILQLRARARRLYQQFGIKLFVIDYLQLLHSFSRRADSRQQEIAEISGGIKALAKELGVPIIVLSQLNREIEKRGPGERPRLSDLRESGAVEQDSDVVGLLFRKKFKEDEDDYSDEQETIPITLFIAKQRNGPTGDVELTFFKPITRFESAARVSTEDANYPLPYKDK